MQDLWWLFSIVASFVFAMFIFSNQIFQLKGSLVMIYRGIGASVVLAPFAFFVPRIDSSLFYYLCIFQGLLIAYFDNRLFNASKKFGAEITSIIQPISVILIFVLWLAITPSELSSLLENTNKLVSSIIALTAIAYSVTMLKKNSINMEAFKYLLPALLSITIIDTIGKELMIIGSDNVFSAIFYYALITSFIAGSANLIAYIKQKNPIAEIFSIHHILHVGIPIIILILSMYLFKNYSLYLTSNPAYVMAIIYTYPIWIFLANNLFHKYQNDELYAHPSKKLIALIFASVILLILTV